MAVKAAKLKDIHDHRKAVIHGDHTEKRKEQQTICNLRDKLRAEEDLQDYMRMKKERE